MIEETVTKPMSLMDIIPPLLPADTTPPPTHTPSSTRTLRPRPARHAIPERVPVSRKRGHAQRDDMAQEQLLPRKRGKMSGVARRSGSAGADDAYGVDGATSTRVGGVRKGPRQTGDVVVKEEAVSASVLFLAVGGGVSGGSAGSGLLPTRDVEAEVGVQGGDGVKVEVKREVKEESGDDEDGEDGEYYDDDEDDCGSGDTGEDSDGGTASVKTETKREVKREVRRDMGERVEEDVSHGTVQLTATQGDIGVRTRRNPWVSATNPHGFMPATLARLQELSPEAREREVKGLLKKRERTAKRLSNPAVRQVTNVRKKEWFKKNIEKEKQRVKEWYEKNKEYAKQLSKEWRENNKKRVAQLQKEYREKNKEYVKQQRKEYYENNKEKVRQRHKEYREKNKDKVTQLKKEYREKNKEYVKQQRKDYYEKNKEKVKQQRKDYHEKNKEKYNVYQREMRARKKAEREAAQRAATGAHVVNA